MQSQVSMTPVLGRVALGGGILWAGIAVGVIIAAALQAVDGVTATCVVAATGALVVCAVCVMGSREGRAPSGPADGSPGPPASLMVAPVPMPPCATEFDVVQEVRLALAYVCTYGFEHAGFRPVAALDTDFRTMLVRGNRVALRTHLIRALNCVLLEARITSACTLRVAIRLRPAGVFVHVTFPGLAPQDSGPSILQAGMPIVTDGDALGSLALDVANPGAAAPGRLVSVGVALPTPQDLAPRVPVDLSVPAPVLQAMLVPRSADADSAPASAYTVDQRHQCTTLTLALPCALVPKIVVLESEDATVLELRAALGRPGVLAFGLQEAAATGLTPDIMRTVTHVFLSIDMSLSDGRDAIRFFRKTLGFRGVVFALVDARATRPAEGADGLDAPEYFQNLGFDFIIHKQVLDREVLQGIMQATE